MSAPDEAKPRFPIVLVGVIVVGALAVVLWMGGLGWAKFQSGRVTRTFSSGQKPEVNVYEATAKGPVSLANFVRELRVAWPGENVATVHAAAAELATGLLHHDDIEIGSIEKNTFVPWPESRWAAVQKIVAELQATPDFLSDENRYVFRRK